MKLSERVKPISYLKANAAEVIKDLKATGEPLIITQNGHATAVVQDIESYEKTQETLALLKILAMGERQIKEGKTVPVEEAMKRVRARTREMAKTQ